MQTSTADPDEAQMAPIDLTHFNPQATQLSGIDSPWAKPSSSSWSSSLTVSCGSARAFGDPAQAALTPVYGAPATDGCPTQFGPAATLGPFVTPLFAYPSGRFTSPATFTLPRNFSSFSAIGKAASGAVTVTPGVRLVSPSAVHAVHAAGQTTDATASRAK